MSEMSGLAGVNSAVRYRVPSSDNPSLQEPPQASFPSEEYGPSQMAGRDRASGQIRSYCTCYRKSVQMPDTAVAV